VAVGQVIHYLALREAAAAALAQSVEMQFLQAPPPVVLEGQAAVAPDQLLARHLARQDLQIQAVAVDRETTGPELDMAAAALVDTAAIEQGNHLVEEPAQRRLCLY
jgi:hypothetical protein